jgi:hypothetical protein
MSEGPKRIGGTLGELFPTQDLAEPLPREPVHARVLESHAGDERALVFASFEAPESALALHQAARPRVEAALLAELACPPSRAPDASLKALRFHLFRTLEGAHEALAAFGFTPLRSLDGLRDELARLRADAQRVGLVRDDDPEASFVARVAPAGLDQVEAALRHAVSDEVFGERPGSFARNLGRTLTAVKGLPPFEPTFAGLDRLEAALFSAAHGELRLLPQATFQAFCDAVAVVACEDARATVEWAESRPDDTGLAPPPLVRVRLAGGWVHLPLGLHLLRWCVMPRRSGEDVPPVSAWLRDQLSI